MDENVEVVAEAPAPVPEPTAVVEQVEKPAEVAPKTFTQEDLDAAIGKRLAREQRKWERERQLAPPAVEHVDPKPEQFASVAEYADALATQKAAKMVHDREIQRQQAEVLGAYHDREEDARAKYDDFERVAYNPQVRITNEMAQTIQSSDVGPDLAYYLGSNPKEADRISRLHPLVQAKEIGRIEAKLASEPPVVKKTSSAPAPIAPVTARGSNTPAYDTTDSRSVKTMSTSEWINAENARLLKRLETKAKAFG